MWHYASHRLKWRTLSVSKTRKTCFSLDMRCFLHCDEKFLHLWWKTGSKKKNISHSKTSQTNCSEHRMICSRFLSDYLEIFSAPPRKSLDNHSKTSHRSSCFPHSFFEVVEYENYYFWHRQHATFFQKVCIITLSRGGVSPLWGWITP